VDSWDNRTGAQQEAKVDDPPSPDDKETSTEAAAEKHSFGGQVSFGRNGKLKGTASLKNWKKDSE
jgi:hypothetical protein